MITTNETSQTTGWLTRTQQLYTYIATIALFVVLNSFWGFQYEEFTDVFFNTGLSGAVTGTPTGFFTNYLNLTFISWGLAAMYSWFPQVPWYGSMLVLAMFFNTALLLQILWFLYKKRSLAFFILLLTIPFWIENVVYIQYTRVTYFTAAVPLLIFVFRQLIPGTNKPSLSSLLLLNALLIWSAFTRLEPISLALMFYSLFYLIAGMPRAKIISSVKFFAPALVSLSCLWLIINVNFTASDKEYQSLRAYSNTLWDFSQNASSLKLKNEKDSAVFYAASNYFLNDRARINDSAFAAIGLMPKDKLPVSVKYYLNDLGVIPAKLQGLFTAIYYKHWHRAFLLLGILLLGVAITVYYKINWGKYLLLHLSVWGVLLLITMFMKMEDRVLVPTMLLLCFLSAAYLFSHSLTFSSFKNATAAISIAGMAYFAFVNFMQLNETGKRYAQLHTYISAVKTETETLFPNQLLIYNLWTYNLFFQSPMDYDYLPPKARSISIDNGLFYMLPAYNTQAYKLFGTNQFADIIKNCLSRKSEIVFLSDESRMQVLGNYLKTMYGIDLNYQIVHPEATLNQPHIFLNWDVPFSFHYYQLK